MDNIFLSMTIILLDYSYYAIAKFFAIADDNHMPIKRIMIDWDDPMTGFITNKNQYGRYANYKPYCESTSGDIGHCWKKNTKLVPDLITCQDYEDKIGECPIGSGEECVKQANLPPASNLTFDTQFDSFNTSRFGDDPARACTPKPFLADYTYTCTTQNADVAFGTLTKTQQNQIISLLGPGNEPESVCVYRPRVQVFDNWGFCNGSINAAENHPWQKGWLAQKKLEQTDNYTVEGFVVDGDGIYDGGLGKCDSSLLDKTEDLPWTYYQGLIIVVPND